MVMMAAQAEPVDVGALQQRAQQLALHESPVWKALLHTDGAHANIDDHDFILSHAAFSPAAELQLTLDYLYRGAPAQVCRFPARYQWLRQQLNAPELALHDCPDVREFREKAPTDRIALVFASENLAQPSSMMGHVFLKLEGQNTQGQPRSHAISFYTDADTINVPKLFYDSMIIGKDGYFALAPYHEKQSLYVDEEQRSIWEYELALDANQRELLALHLLELKQTRLTYFFQKYNCATLVNFIIGLAGKPLPENAWWVTPRDVIRNANEAGLIRSSQTITTSRWLSRALAQRMSREDKQRVRQSILSGQLQSLLEGDDSDADFLRLELARHWNQYAWREDLIDRSRWLDNDARLLQARATRHAHRQIEMGQQFNPMSTPPERQIGVFLAHRDQRVGLGLTLQPVSHTLDDDNRNYTTENSLQLFRTTLYADVERSRLELDELIVYRVQSLMPHETLTGGVSGTFGIAWEGQRDARLDLQRALTVSGAIGYTWRALPDLDLYALGGAGAGYDAHKLYLYPEPRIGAVIREIWDMKSTVDLQYTHASEGASAAYYRLRAVQSHFLNRRQTINLQWERYFNGDRDLDQVSLHFKWLF